MVDHSGCNHALIDNDRVACLGNGWHAAVCVKSDGDTVLWLLAPDADDDDHADTSGLDTEHEQLGRLPAPWRRRVNQCQATCRTTRGKQCRNPVDPPGRYCHLHQVAP